MARCSLSVCRRWRPDVAVRLAKLGIHMDGAWFCADRCVKAAAAERLRSARAADPSRRRPARRLGAVLLQQRTISASQLADALESQRKSGLRLGAELQRLGYASREGVLCALAAQCGVSYLAAIDVRSVHAAPGRLSAEEVRALGVVPFKENEDGLLVACAAPLPYAALGALQVLMGRSVEPFLVADEDLARLTNAYGVAVDDLAQVTTVRDIPEGASRIAAAAAAAGDVTVREARVDPFTWVRIAANGRISSLLVSSQAPQWEERRSWPAATT